MLVVVVHGGYCASGTVLVFITAVVHEEYYVAHKHTHR